ncbi:NfeD family protein [Chloroflexota bacterium]
MRGRLIIAIVSTTLEETALAVGVLWGLPKLGIHIPLWVLIIVMLAWCTYTITTYRMGSRALRKKPIAGLLNMFDSEGEVVSPLMPEGMVRIKSELWKAKSESGEMNTGEKITVVGQDRLQLIVRKRSAGDLDENK